MSVHQKQLMILSFVCSRHLDLKRMMGLMYLGIKDSPYAMPFDRCKKIAGGMILANLLLLFLSSGGRCAGRR